LNIKEMFKYIKKDEDLIYDEYINIISEENSYIRHWINGDIIMYKGNDFKIVINQSNIDYIEIIIKEEEKIFEINIPFNLNEKNRIMYIEKSIKELFKNNTKIILKDKLVYWSNKMNLKYNNVKIRDKKTNFGTCKPLSGDLSFNSRIIMLSDSLIDAIIVHELSHLKYPNHSANFYNLVKKYIPKYDEYIKWLKENNNKLVL
ncbi:MAG: M48 family metallopeptidase, partial [Clostridia bacterium]